MKRLIFDLDGTLTHDDSDVPYPQKKPNEEVVRKLREYHVLGFEIVIATSRNVRTYENNVGKINANTLPLVIEWLRRHDIPYDEIYVAKPWCGFDGFYIDDKSVRPSEFAQMSYEQIKDLLAREKLECNKQS